MPAKQAKVRNAIKLNQNAPENGTALLETSSSSLDSFAGFSGFSCFVCSGFLMGFSGIIGEDKINFWPLYSIVFDSG